jgi:hypothetical protein
MENVTKVVFAVQEMNGTDLWCHDLDGVVYGIREHRSSHPILYTQGKVVKNIEIKHVNTLEDLNAAQNDKDADGAAQKLIVVVTLSWELFVAQLKRECQPEENGYKLADYIGKKTNAFEILSSARRNKFFYDVIEASNAKSKSAKGLEIETFRTRLKDQIRFQYRNAQYEILIYTVLYGISCLALSVLERRFKDIYRWNGWVKRSGYIDAFAFCVGGASVMICAARACNIFAVRDELRALESEK